MQPSWRGEEALDIKSQFVAPDLDSPLAVNSIATDGVLVWRVVQLRTRRIVGCRKVPQTNMSIWKDVLHCPS